MGMISQVCWGTRWQWRCASKKRLSSSDGWSFQTSKTNNNCVAVQVCTTLGMLTPEQARELREAGLTAYNHNLDTSPEYYGQITTTRK